jgi:hypothetical protein
MGYKKKSSLNPTYRSIQVGSDGNFFTVDENGNVVLLEDATSWDDARFPSIGQSITSPAGRIDFNFDDCTVDFQDTALYPTDELCIVAQMSHSKLLGSAIEVHIHWLQNQNATPNWLLGYRWTNIGENAIAVGSETLLPFTTNARTYSSGTIHQLTSAGTITKGVADTISSVLQIRIFRDTTNASGLFAGADPYTGNAQQIEFDIHYQRDGFGSNQEYVK